MFICFTAASHVLKSRKAHIGLSAVPCSHIQHAICILYHHINYSYAYEKYIEILRQMYIRWADGFIHLNLHCKHWSIYRNSEERHFFSDTRKSEISRQSVCKKFIFWERYWVHFVSIHSRASIHASCSWQGRAWDSFLRVQASSCLPVCLMASDH